MSAVDTPDADVVAAQAIPTQPVPTQPAAVVQPVDGMPRARWSTRLLRSEMRIMFGRRRNQLGLAVLAVVPIVIGIAVDLSSSNGQVGGPSFFQSITDNGLFVALAALTVELPLFLPLAVSAIAGDSIAGEANLGTLRYLLTVPVHRTRLLVTKYLAIVIFALAATALVAAAGIIIGLILFPAGPVTLLSGNQASLGTGLLRVLGATGYLAAGFAALGAIGLFISTLTEQPIAALIATVLVNVVMFIMDTIPQLSFLQPWLLTHWWSSFADLFRDPVLGSNIGRGLATDATYAAVFWLCAWARFSAKDVTS